MTLFDNGLQSGEDLQLRLFGEAVAEVGTLTTPLPSDMRYQLLVHLACQKDWVRRDDLLYLFWADSPTVAARNRLRQLLRRVRALEVPTLEVKGQYLRWSVSSDVTVFREAVAQQQWARAASAHRAPLLAGFEHDASPEYQSWPVFERNSLREQWRYAVHSGARELEHARRYLDAADLLRHLVTSDELDEQALMLYMRLLVKAGGHAQALKAYERYVLSLRQDLDLPPTTELEQFVETLQSNRRGVMLEDRQEVTSSGLPVQTSSFVGRRQELSDIAARLRQPECRLLTLSGGGGVGKTQLASQIAAHHSPAPPTTPFLWLWKALRMPKPFPLPLQMRCS